MSTSTSTGAQSRPSTAAELILVNIESRIVITNKHELLPASYNLLPQTSHREHYTTVRARGMQMFRITKKRFPASLLCRAPRVSILFFQSLLEAGATE